MKKIFLGIFAVLCFAACEQENVKHISETTDSLTIDLGTESLTQVVEKVKHPGPDGFFDDFIYLFMQDESLQFARIKFPLVYRKDGQQKLIDRSEWQYDSIYSGLSENTFIADGNYFDDEDSLPNLHSATVEMIDLKTLCVKQYKFSLIENQWILVELCEESLNGRNDEDFYVFYSKFVNDEKYQMSHIHNPFYFKTFDNDIDEEIKGWVAAEQWPAYRIFMPTDTINNILYDNRTATSNYRTFVISSPSSGMNCNLIFKYVEKRWLLVRMEN